MTQTTARPTVAAANGKTYEGRQRQTVHALKRILGYSEIEYRNQLRALTGHAHASDLTRRDLAYVIDVFNEFVDAREAEGKRPYLLPYVSDAEAAEVLA